MFNKFPFTKNPQKKNGKIYKLEAINIYVVCFILKIHQHQLEDFVVANAISITLFGR